MRSTRLLMISLLLLIGHEVQQTQAFVLCSRLCSSSKSYKLCRKLCDRKSGVPHAHSSVTYLKRGTG